MDYHTGNNNVYAYDCHGNSNGAATNKIANGIQWQSVFHVFSKDGAALIAAIHCTTKTISYGTWLTAPSCRWLMANAWTITLAPQMFTCTTAMMATIRPLPQVCMRELCVNIAWNVFANGPWHKWLNSEFLLQRKCLAWGWQDVLPERLSRHCLSAAIWTLNNVFCGFHCLVDLRSYWRLPWQSYSRHGQDISCPQHSSALISTMSRSK